MRPMNGISTGIGVIDDFLGGGQTTQTTSNELPSTVKPLGEAAVEGLLGTTAPTYYPGQTVAGQSTDTTGGISGLSAAAGAQSGVADTAAGGFDFTMNQMLDPASNQALQDYIAYAIDPVMSRLENQTLPGIGGDAILAGQFGGTAQQNLTLDALEAAQRDAYGTSSQIASNAYNTSLDNYTNTLLNAGKIQDTQATPATTQLLAGNIQDEYAQNLINAEIDRYNFGQTADTDYWTNILNTVMSSPQNSTTTQTGGGTDLVDAALSAYMIYSLSDVRLKEDIVKVGEHRPGIGLYDFKYKGNPNTYRGVMAQEVLTVNPGAVVTTPSGYLAVNYNLL